jgi:hypothetical protein
MGEEHRRKLLANETLFRTVNDSLARAPDTDSMLFLCECSYRDCSETVRLTRAEYRRIREGTQRFIIHAGHEHAENEQVVEAHGAYLVVEPTEPDPPTPS